MSGAPTSRWAQVWHQVLRPPLGEPRFWIMQAMVIGLAGIHLAIDFISATPSAIPAGIPVALLLAPVTYAALRYGLAGSVATAMWATVLWLPDLLLSSDRGHVGNDSIELALVVAVAVFAGYHIDAERLEHAQSLQARGAQQIAEARYRQLFDINAAPILVAYESGRIMDANPAARALVSENVVGRPYQAVLGISASQPEEATGQVIALSAPKLGLRYYRVHVGHMSARAEQQPLIQLVLQDITEDRAEGDRAHRFAELLLRVQEEERKRIAQELHDEPLQLLVHLARTLERLENSPEHGPAAGADGLGGARDQTLDIAARLRAVMAGLRPPALEQLGLVAALRGFLADIGETATVRTDLRVTGEPVRLAAETELGAFRIAQEAVNNVIRHAGASQLLLTLAFADGGLCLQVADDGRGFDPTAVDRQLVAGRLGLLGMRERAALAGGHLTMSSAPGGGTVVEVAFPGNGLAEGFPIGPPIGT